jgi:hypothetical protein
MVQRQPSRLEAGAILLGQHSALEGESATSLRRRAPQYISSHRFLPPFFYQPGSDTFCDVAAERLLFVSGVITLLTAWDRCLDSENLCYTF